ncbi:hypothetical protein CEXT_711851 [Caerostris extrusa]|uniref:Uncharacterized protein n=1 Tax=Caerostris extrusa TaxID=172846 RepID=A0AAV4MP83_CAEEX|nr:hypothetical protein CEXT_711851 [Caerostris extrusa]
MWMQLNRFSVIYATNRKANQNSPCTVKSIQRNGGYHHLMPTFIICKFPLSELFWHIVMWIQLAQCQGHSLKYLWVEESILNRLGWPSKSTHHKFSCYDFMVDYDDAEALGPIYHQRTPTRNVLHQQNQQKAKAEVKHVRSLIRDEVSEELNKRIPLLWEWNSVILCSTVPDINLPSKSTHAQFLASGESTRSRSGGETFSDHSGEVPEELNKRIPLLWERNSVILCSTGPDSLK